MKMTLLALITAGIALADDPSNFTVDANVSFPDRKEVTIGITNLENREIRCTIKVSAKVKVNESEFQTVVLGKKVTLKPDETETIKLGKERVDQVAPGAVYTDATIQSTKCEYYDSSDIPGECYQTSTRFTTDGGGCKDKNTGRVYSAISDELMKFTDALKYCDNLEEGGKDDWRVPTYENLDQVKPDQDMPFFLALPASISAPPTRDSGARIELFTRHKEDSNYLESEIGRQICITFFYSDSSGGVCTTLNSPAHAVCVRGPKT